MPILFHVMFITEQPEIITSCKIFILITHILTYYSLIVEDLFCITVEGIWINLKIQTYYLLPLNFMVCTLIGIID